MIDYSNLINSNQKFLCRSYKIAFLFQAVCEKLNGSKSELEDEIFFLEKDLEEEKSKHSEQDELVRLLYLWRLQEKESY